MGEPLYLDVVMPLCAAASSTAFLYSPAVTAWVPRILLLLRSSLFTTTLSPLSPRSSFTVGIDDDVTHLSLEIDENPDTAPEGTISCKFWGLGCRRYRWRQQELHQDHR